MEISNIEINWLGHAGFQIKGGGKVIYIDPYKIGVNDKADIIFITHPHYDHCSVEDLMRVVKPGTVVVCPPGCQSKIARIEGAEIQLIQEGDSFSIKDVGILVFPAYNREKEFHQKAEGWVGYVLKFKKEGVAIYHAGDTDLIPEMKRLTGFENLIALLPVGGTYTMDAEQASEATRIIKPKFAVPMHWGEVVGGEKDADRFVELCKVEGVEARKLEKI